MHKKSGSAPRDNNKNSSAGFKRNGQGGSAKPYGNKEGGKRDDNPFKRSSSTRSNDDRPFRERGGDDGDKKRSFPKRDGDKPFSRDNDRPFKKDGDRPFKRDGDKPFSKGGDRPFKRDGDKPFRKDGDKPYKKDGDRTFNKSSDRSFKKDSDSFKKDGDKTYEKKYTDKPFGRSKPKTADDNAGKWERGNEDGKQPFPKRVKPFPKKEDKPYSGRPTTKPFESKPKPAAPTKDIYDPLDISEEKRNNRKAPPERKNDPSRAFKKETNEPISSRYGDKPKKVDRTPKKRTEKSDEKRPFKKSAEDAALERGKPFDRKKQRTNEDDTESFDEGRPDKFSPKKRHHHHHDDDEDDDEIETKGPEAMPLNKYLAHSGVCSRRDAAILVKEGKVKLNDVVITDPGHKVEPDDVVTYNDKKLTLQKGMVYILLNKPKDYITTNEDPQGRKTVMDLLMGADAERLFPVGRLDRNTSGLLLITNDGDLTQKLAHPSYKVKKIYQVTLDKPVTKADFEKIANGLELEDGIAHVDALAYLDTKNEIGIEIHIGKNRIVRRIFESLGYEVEKLDRVMYGSLTKKNLPRGKWRYLNEREIVLLKHFKS